MNAVIEAIGRFLSSWKPWVVVAPWEKGVRVRLGRTALQLEPGCHLRIPVLDRIVLVNTRLRTVTVSSVTISSARPGYARVRTPVVGYLVTDPLKAVGTYNNPHTALSAFVQVAAATGAGAEACLSDVRAAADGHGLQIEFLRFAADVEIKAFRILQAEWAMDNTDQTHGNEAVVRY